MTRDDYKHIVEKANMAVQGIKDAELRRVAFEKILDDLLRGSAKPSKKPTPAAPKPAKGGKRRSVTSHGPKGRVEELINEGFFKKPKTISEVRAELGNRGHHFPRTSLSGPLQALCRERKLRRQKMKVGKKTSYGYSNW